MMGFSFRNAAVFPLVTFRIVFGMLMCFGTIRFMQRGWVADLFATPDYFFKYHGFEWVQPMGETALYYLHGAMALSAFFIAIGLLYRFSTLFFFLSFAYVELLDATNYLNHYYLVLLLAFWMIFLPANAAVSVDALLFPKIKRSEIPAWCIHVIIGQFCIVYFFAGFAKLNPDWMLRGMPMSIWLPERQHIPILGYFFQFPITAKIASWFGAFYDLTIWAFMLHPKSRPVAYPFVVFFHLMTSCLFNIGLFPYIMMLGTLIFFSGKWHARFYPTHPGKPAHKHNDNQQPSKTRQRVLACLFTIYFGFQVLFPLRIYLYGGNYLWHEQGYRFGWRVMLVEKSGHARFFAQDPATGDKVEIRNAKYLTPFQEKQMAIQPDFILQFARIIDADYKERMGIDPIITADIHVALNRRVSSLFIKNDVDLSEAELGWKKPEWLLAPRD